MSPGDLVKTVYLGDRACKSILILGWENEVKVQVTRISRTGPDGAWVYNDSNDLIDGFLVFEGVKDIQLSPPGYLPNDLIVDFRATKQESGCDWNFALAIESVNALGDRAVIDVRIVASSFALEPCDEKGVRIRS